MSEVIIKELKASYSGHNSNLVKDWNREIIYGDGQWGIWLYWSALYPEDKIATKVTDKYNEGLTKTARWDKSCGTYSAGMLIWHDHRCAC